MSTATKVKLIAAGVVTLLALITVGILWGGLVGYNNNHEYQVYQSIFGKVSVIDTSGYYFKGFGTVWTYPRSLQHYYSASVKEGGANDDSIRVTFNDGGTAQISSFVKIAFPADEKHRLLLHQDFSANPKNVVDAVRSHLTNCIKSTGPMMSASENQASRKAEFNQVVEEQLTKGLFEMRRTEVELNDAAQLEATGNVDANGKPIMREKKAKVLATEIVEKDGKPVIVQPSPLERYNIGVTQFSVTETQYDDKTLEQFSAKKESYLAAERAKAQRQEEQQQRLMIVERGLRQVAEIEAAQNQEKKKATIAAEQKKEVAAIEKDQAVIAAEQKVEVAAKTQLEAETLKKIAKLKAETAEIDKQATIAAAEAKQKTIELGGGISEKERVLAEIKADRDAKVAAALASVRTPNIVLGSGGTTAGGTGNETLLNLLLLKSMGVLPADNATTATK
ncbi:MAG: SPFH domain-containing protein [Thermoguttaceae bacterium]